MIRRIVTGSMGGRSGRLRRCVIDRACVIPEGMVIGENAEEDARRFYCSEEGIVPGTRECYGS
ncbi:hypothetical protein ACNKHT_22420 [Shigella flexneri]